MSNGCAGDGLRQPDSDLSGRGIRRAPDPGLAPRRRASRCQPRALRLSPSRAPDAEIFGIGVKTIDGWISDA